jgi:hypothetical protein
MLCGGGETPAQLHLHPLPHRVSDPLVLGQHLRAVLGAVTDSRRRALVLPGVRGDVTQDAHLGEVGVVLRVDVLQLRMQGLIAGAGQPGVSLVDLGVGISLAEVDEVVGSGRALSARLYISQIDMLSWKSP